MDGIKKDFCLLHYAFTQILGLWVVLGCNEGPEFASGNQRPLADATSALPEMEPINQTFPAATILNESIVLDTEFGIVRQAFALYRDATHRKSFRQIERRQGEETFQQGHPGAERSEDFDIIARGPLDLLIVVDKSASLRESLKNLGNRLDPLLSKIANTDWQIATVTTDDPCVYNENRLMRSEYDEAPEVAKEKFLRAIAFGDNGSTAERGIEMAVKGLAGICSRGDRVWTRSGSTRAVLIVTDESNCGSGSNDFVRCKSVDEGGTGEFDRYTKDDFVASHGPNVKVFGILRDRRAESDGGCGNGGYFDPEPEFKNDYFELVAATSGKWLKFCAEEYSDFLKEISKDISGVVVREFKLEFQPDPDSIRLTIDQRPYHGQYALNNRQLILKGELPSPGRRLFVNYRHGERPRRDSFLLMGDLDPRTLEVHFNSDSISRDEYLFDEDTRLIHFGIMPPDGVEIGVRYRIDDPLPQTYPIGEDFLERTLFVTLNSDDVFDVEIEDLTVTISPPPLDGDDILIQYSKESDFQTRYPLVEIANEDVASFTLVDASNNVSVAGEVQNGELVLPLEEVENGRVINGTFRLANIDAEKLIQLPHPPYDGKVSIFSDGVDCQSRSTIDHTSLRVACETPEVSEIVIEYQYISVFHSEFSIDGYIAAGAVWRVFIDGEETTDFEIEGSTVRLHADLPPRSQVTVRVDPAPDPYLERRRSYAK